METQKVTYFKNNWELTELPNGSFVVSSDRFKQEDDFLRKYSIIIAGGRLADVDAPGSSLIIADTLPKYLNNRFKNHWYADSFKYSVNYSYSCLEYTHHGKDDHDAKCIALIIDTMMNDYLLHDFSSVASIEVERVARSEHLENYWCWFFQVTAPECYRLAIPSWIESSLALSNRNNCVQYLSKIANPANIMVCSPEPNAHEDIAEKLALLCPRQNFNEKVMFVDSGVIVVEDEYCKARQLRNKHDILLYYPLAFDRGLFIKSILVLYALYGSEGFIRKIMKKNKINFSIEICATFWPRPFAFLRICSAGGLVSTAMHCVALSGIVFGDLSDDIKMIYYKQYIHDLIEKFGFVGDILRDEWLLCGIRDFVNRDRYEFSLDDLEAIRKTYFSEARMGVLHGIPPIPKGVSLFNAL